MRKMSKRSLAILGTRGIPAAYGGFETFAEELAVRLVERGIDVTVFCEKGDDADTLEEYKGVQLVRVDTPSMGPLTTIVFDCKCLWRARKSYDVIYMLGYGASPFCFIPRLWRRNVWINMDGIEWSRSKWNWMAKLWLRFTERAATWTANMLVADAAGIRQHLQSRYRSLPEICVIPYGADIVESDPAAGFIEGYGLRSGAYYLVVCRLEPENHVMEIIEGFVASDSTCPLVIVGDASVDNPFVRALRKFTDDRLRFVGTIYEKEKLQSLRLHCRAYFHGHSVGGTNPSLLEALGCGNRVIAHDNVFNREVAADCAAYFSSASDIPTIVSTFDAKPPADNSRQASQQRVRDQYNWSDVADCYFTLLQSD
jgi:glycosyltransferase involved in cell wall biosynthesis